MRALGLDTGIATAGWAVADRTGRVIDLGVSILDRQRDLGARDDLVRRAAAQAATLNALLPSVACVVCEAISWGMPGANARAMTAMSVGIITGLVAAHGKPLHFVAPKAWQDLVAPHRKKGDYAAITTATVAHLQRSGIGPKLAQIKSAHRNHAIDASALAVYGALHHLG